jgi:tetratricopeptide (TPR) repeat protein
MAAVVAAIVAWWAYAPAFHGPFVFDDTYFVFAQGRLGQPLMAWITGVRPATMFSYWLNSVISGDDPFSYHVLSLLLHMVTSGLVFLIVRRLLERAGAPTARSGLAAGFAAVVFLLHPAQTEAVAYISGRSECVSALLAFAAFAVFLYRPQPAISWGRAVVVLALFGLALLGKEHIVVLPALFLLTDYWWNPGFSATGIRGNWRIYLPMAAGGAAGVAFFWNLILHSPSAGFGLQDLPWYQYLFTQFRAIFVYLRIFVLPVNLTADWDFPFSRTILDRGAIFGLLALAALVAAAWLYRRRFPLATYGFLAFLLLLAPTSSILPIKDPVAERRLYFAMPGLLLMLADLAVRMKLDRRTLAGACAAVAVVLALVTHARAAVWGDAVALWQDTVRRSPDKPRVHLQLAQAYFDAQRYDLAIGEFEIAARLERPDYNLLVNWGEACDRMNQLDQALAKFREAAALDATAHVYSQIGMVYAQRGQRAEAMDALATAERIDPSWAATYNYRAKLHFQAAEWAAAAADYQRALALDPRLADARDELARAQAMLVRGGH